MVMSYAAAVLNRVSPATPPPADPWPALPSRATPSSAAPSRAAPSSVAPSRAGPSSVAPSRATPTRATPSLATPSLATPSLATPPTTKPHALPDNAEEIQRERDFWAAHWGPIFREDNEREERAYWTRENAKLEREFFGDLYEDE